MLLVTGVDATVSPTALLGDAMALAGGAAAAGYSLTAETARREMSTASYSAVANSVCAALTLVVCLVLGVSLVGFSAVTWTEVAVIAVCSQVVGHALLNRAVLRAGRDHGDPGDPARDADRLAHRLAVAGRRAAAARACRARCSCSAASRSSSPARRQPAEQPT